VWQELSEMKSLDDGKGKAGREHPRNKRNGTQLLSKLCTT
jgi:hypothetical protein